MRALLTGLLLAATLVAPAPAAAELLGLGDAGTWLVADDTGTRTALPERAYSGSWSPDGERLVLSTTRRNEPWRLVVGPPSGPFTELTGSADLHDPAWSPDGTTIAAVRQEGAVHRIVLLPAVGGTPRAITADAKDSHPTWSPDGTEVAFDRVDPSVDAAVPVRNLMAVRTDGTGLRTITKDGDSPDWSPDGTRIAFATTRDDNGEACENEGTEEAYCYTLSEIHTVRPDGTDDRRLTTSASDDDRPSWSPDGTRIAFASDRHWRSDELWAMDADGGCLTQLTIGYDAIFDVAWRRGPLPAGRGACGVRVAPFNALDFAPLARQAKTDPLFPGVPYRGMWPVAADRGSLDYNECSLTRRRDCGGRITVWSRTTCGRNPARSTVPALAVERHRGALVLHFSYRVHVISGGTTTEIYADNGRRRFLRRLVAQLRPLSRPGRVARRLAAPQLPPQAWRALQDSARVRRGVRERASLVSSDRKVLRALERLDAGRRPACAR